jgi:hypothetical protein
MKRTDIKVKNTIKADYSYETGSNFRLDEPSLSNGCEECGIYKGSCLEVRLIYLMRFYDGHTNKEAYLCEKCFLHAHAKHYGKPEEIIKRRNSIVVSHWIGDGIYEYRLKEPWLPEACEDCGAYKGSSFEDRLMNLICLNGKEDGRFFCEKCFEKIKPKDLDRQLVDC